MLLLSIPAHVNGQLRAFGGKENDNNCKVIYLVNPSDSIFYIAGLKQTQLNECQTFSNNSYKDHKYFKINVSNNEDNYLLLLPKDTIAYNILMNAESNDKEKQLVILVRSSPDVISTNNDKRRNRQISRLPGWWINLPVIEK